MRLRRSIRITDVPPLSREDRLGQREFPARRSYRSDSRTRCRLHACACHDGHRSHNFAVGGRERRRIGRSGYRIRSSSRRAFRHAT